MDRAALLASLLHHAGHRVRHGRGTLPDRESRDLVTSKWAERSKPPPKNGNMASPLLKMASETLLSAAKRDYILIRNQLTSANKGKPGDDQRVGSRSGLPGVRSTGRTTGSSGSEDGTWVDLDPSFTDATLGYPFARVEETFETLPDVLFDRVTIRVRLEYTGDRPSS